MDNVIISVVAIISIFVCLPGIIFFASYKKRKDENELAKLSYQKDLMELEIRNNETKARVLELENKKFDNLLSKD